MSQQIQNSQEQLLHLLINDRDLLEDFLQINHAVDLFDQKFRILIKGIIHANSLSVQLTRDSYKNFVNKETGGKIQAHLSEDQIFVLVTDLTIADKNDYPMLVDSVQENFIKNKSKIFFDSFKLQKDKNYKESLRNLVNNFESVLADSGSSKYQFLTLKSYFDEWYNDIIENRNNPQKRIYTGIKEIDECMHSGLSDGELTLFVAEPGGMKSMMMLNIALNVFMDLGETVLYVSLEMTREKVMNRIISRETGIDMKKISQPELLDQDELDKIFKAKEKWLPKMSDFGIIDNEERMTVGEIRRFIEKNYSIFKPKLVVIDYIAILQPDEKYLRQNEYSWAGEMCKDIRQLGRKYKFSIISAVQLGKESLKKLKSQKQGKQSAGVEDMRGSHDYSSDADYVFIQWPHQNEPSQKLCLVCAKARNGQKTFVNGSVMAVLEVKPNIQRICSDNVAKWQMSDKDPLQDVMYGKFGAKPPKIQDLDDLGEEPSKAKQVPMSKQIAKANKENEDWLDI